MRDWHLWKDCPQVLDSKQAVKNCCQYGNDCKNEAEKNGKLAWETTLKAGAGEKKRLALKAILYEGVQQLGAVCQGSMGYRLGFYEGR